MQAIRAALIVTAATLAVNASAQQRPTPAAPPAPPAPPVWPAPLTPLPDMTPLPTMAPEPTMAPDVPEPFLYQGPGRRPPIDRTEIERIRDEAQRAAREQGRIAMEQSREQIAMARDQARDQARIEAERAMDHVRASGQFGMEFGREFGREFGPAFGGGFNSAARPPAPWAQRDPADSLYRAAYELMNRGDYRKAAAAFKEIPQKFPNSAYAADAMYWSAHALYRVGSTPDLQDALQTLEQLKQKYTNTRLRNSQSDVAALEVRIAGVLSARGQGGSDIVKRALAQNSGVCDTEEEQIRAAALNALMQTDPDAAAEYAQKALARKDDCSADMRRTAVFLIGNRGDPKATATLIGVAKADPSIEVRASAVQYLGRLPGDDALNALEALARSDSEPRVQREAIRQLARNANPRARSGIKALVERNDVSDNLRIAALDALDPERSTQEDVAWLQATYAKVDSPRIRSRIISAIARIGGAQNEKWFTTLANNESESIDVRVAALRQAGQSMDIAALGRLYDQTGQRQLRYELVRQLGSRREPEATDKLGDIAKNGTDVEVRKRAIDALSNKARNDERASKLLLQLIDRP